MFACCMKMGSESGYDPVKSFVDVLVEKSKSKREESVASETQMQTMIRESVADEIVVVETATQLPFVAERHMLSP